MARRQLLTDEERQALFGILSDPDDLARRFSLSRSDRDLVAERRGDASRLGYAVQLALLRHPGTALANIDQPVDLLVTRMARLIEVPAGSFTEYTHRPQTVTDHARRLAAALCLRPPTTADLPLMIEAAAQAAWSTDQGKPLFALWFGVPGRGFGPARRSDGGIGRTTGGIGHSGCHGEHFWDAELHRLVGTVLLAENKLDEGQASLRQAIRIAQAQQAKSLELRAARDLARLWGEQGRRAEARDLLAPVYGWFTEGFDTADLKEAKALLDELM